MRKIKEYTISEKDPKLGKIELKVTINRANDKELRNCHLPFILKLEDSIRYERETLEQIKEVYISNGDAYNYCVWHKKMRMREGILCHYPFYDADKVFCTALKEVGYKVGSEEYERLYELLNVYNMVGIPQAQARFKEMRSDRENMRLLQEFSDRYFLR